MSILSELQDKKLGVVELLSLGYDLWLKNIYLFLILSCIAFPFMIALPILNSYTSKNPTDLGLLNLIYLTFYFFLFCPLFGAVINIAVENCVLNKETQIKSSIRQISHHIFPLLGLSIRFLLNCFGRFLLFIVPGIIYCQRNQFFIPALVLRNQVGKATFQYSRMLVKGNWWRVFFYNLALYIAVFGLLSLTKKITEIFVNSPIAATIISLSVYIFVSMGLSISGVLLFLNLDFQKRQ